MKQRPMTAALHLAAGIPLGALVLVRLWAAVRPFLSGGTVVALAALLTAAALWALWRFDVVRQFVLPDWQGWRLMLVAVPTGLLGVWLDMSYEMFTPAGLIAASPMRALCAVGSGLIFAAIVLAVVKAAGEFGWLRGDWRAFLVVAAVLNLVTALYCFNSATVYTWDGSGYWAVAGKLAREPLSLGQIRAVVQTVLTYDYNYLLAYPISLVVRLFGPGRYVFIAASVNFYLLPGVWGLLVLGRRVKGGLLLPLLGLPMLSYVALLGFVDVAAASLAIWTVVIYTEAERPPVSAGILSGILLTGTFLLRRYFFFFAVSFGVGALAAAVVRRKGGWRKFFALFGAAAITAVFFAQSFLIEKILESSYSVIYAAYQQGRWIDLLMFARYFGALILLAAVGFGVYRLVKGGDGREQATLALVQLAVCFFLLTRVQSHGSQHLLLYAPAIALLLVGGLAVLSARRWRYAALLLAVASLSPLYPRVQPKSPAEIRYPDVLPAFSFNPPRRGDIDALLQLRAFVDGLSADGQKTAAVVASSFVFNSETFTNLYSSLNRAASDVQTPIIYMTGVDKRDGFSWNVLEADYLMVGDPVQTHLGEENQQVMAILAHDVLDGTGPGAAYERMDETFELDGGCTVRLYRRTRAVTDAERRSISERLVAQYPDFADLYGY